jgi:hypothetical protein
MQLLSPLRFSIIRNLFCILPLFTSARSLLADGTSCADSNLSILEKPRSVFGAPMGFVTLDFVVIGA